MKEFLKRVGLIVVGVGVVLLAVSEFSGMEQNNILITSAGFIIGGLLLYVVLNNILD